MSLAESADKAASSFSEIPIIDVSNIYSTNPAEIRLLADQVRNACINVGFFYVKNHGILEEIINTFISESEQYFAKPLDYKMQLENKKQANFTGYSPLLSGNNDPANSGDLQEGFELGWEPFEQVPLAVESTSDSVMPRGNVWPSDAPQFREAALKYYHAALNLGKGLFPLFALALDLNEDFFADKTKNSAALMKVLHYPPQTGPVDDRIMGIGAHTDWECFTILWQQPGIQALQVLNPDKTWVNAPPLPGTLVINLGDQLARWTNGIFKSTVHRAINRSGVERYSIPLFFGTDYDVKLEPIPGCVTESRPMQYEIVTAGEYVQSKLKQTYNHY